MTIPTPTASMLSAINSDLQLHSLESETESSSKLNLGPGKDYTVKISEKGEVSVNRNPNPANPLERVINAVIDFCFRGYTDGESAFTTRSNQLQSEIQRQIDEKPAVDELVNTALSAPQSEFANVAGYLKAPDQPFDMENVNFGDVNGSNVDRLGLTRFSR